jgi:hypothetical protein
MYGLHSIDICLLKDNLEILVVLLKISVQSLPDYDIELSSFVHAESVLKEYSYDSSISIRYSIGLEYLRFRLEKLMNLRSLSLVLNGVLEDEYFRLLNRPL